MKELESQDIEKAKEIGFKIKNVEDNGHEFKVFVQFPDKELTTRQYNFSRTNDNWEEEVEYVEDGEIKKKPKWQKHIEKNIEKNLTSIMDFDGENSSVKNFEGNSLDVK